MSPRQADETTTLLRGENQPGTLSQPSSVLSFLVSDSEHEKLGVSYYQNNSNEYLQASRPRNWHTFLNATLFVASMLFFWRAQSQSTSTVPSYASEPMKFSTNSKYTKVQGLGYQIYTGGAPAYINKTSAEGPVGPVPNPECFGLQSYGSMWTEEGDALQCYIGKNNPEKDVQARLKIMKDAVEVAYQEADADPSVLKIFIAPEFFWRGIDGAYVFDDEAAGDPSICGPVCQILKGLEDYVAQARFEDWFFLFGTIIASEPTSNSTYDSLFYNFAPIYKGYDPLKTTHVGKRFISPKRYLSTSDFMTPQRHLNASSFKELIDEEKRLNSKEQKKVLRQKEEALQKRMEELAAENDDDYYPYATTTSTAGQTVINPVYTRKKYDYNVWMDYKEELDGLGYTLLEYGWLMLDGLALSIEICLDHQLKSALTSYLADSITGLKTLIPSTSEELGLQYVPIPRYQAQVGVVSSAGMTVTTESLALTHRGAIFLQDGLSNQTNEMYWSDTGCELGLQFQGGTEAVLREAFVSGTDSFFEHKALESFRRVSVYEDETWQGAIRKSFSTATYEPELTVFEAIDIAKVHHL